jgi:O-antigen/teichoic acid export membrane protein
MYTRFEGETVRDFVARINDSSVIFGLLMFSFVAISSNYIFGTLLTANNNLRHLNWIALCGLLLNVVLNLLLIPRLYAIGSAYASLTTQGITAILQVFFAFKLLRLRLNIGFIVNVLSMGALLVLTGFLLQYFPPRQWLVSVGIMILTGLVISFVFKLLNIREFVSVLKTE